MTQLSGLLTDDSRTPLEKLRRTQLQKIALDNDIKFDPAGPATALRKLIEGSGVDYMRTDLFVQRQVQDENGQIREIVDPVVKPHATANANIDYDAIIEAKAKEKEEENTELKKELEELKAMVAKLIPDIKPIDPLEVLEEHKILREQYKKVIGKSPHWKMKPETMKERIDAKL